MLTQTWRTPRTRIALAAVGCLAVLVAHTQPAHAAAEQIAGTGVFDTGGACPAPPPPYQNFTSYPPIVMRGDLIGCWYTLIETTHDNDTPSGVYLETGRELFIGHVDDAPVGTFTTTYRFESRWSPDVSAGIEVRGRCQHPIAAGSGTGGLAGVTGRVDFRDIVTDGSYLWRGHLAL